MKMSKMFIVQQTNAKMIIITKIAWKIVFSITFYGHQSYSRKKPGIHHPGTHFPNYCPNAVHIVILEFKNKFAEIIVV